MNKLLLLIDSNKNNFFPHQYKNFVVEEIYKSNSFVSRLFRKFIFFLHIPCGYFFKSWFKSLHEFNTVLIFDTGNAKYITEILRKKNPDLRIIVWYWNSVSKTVNPSQFDNMMVELWSFDPFDCQKYNLKFNTQFFPKFHLDNYSKNQPLKCDAFFIGYDKGRINTLKKLGNLLSSKKISFEFYIVGDIKKRIPEFGTFYKKALCYPEIIALYRSSRVIIDIVSSGQHGLSLRPIEALFLKKKLITNNEQIKKYDFYDKNNVFILGVDDENDLSQFVSTEFKSTYDESYYEMVNWINRFKS